MSLKKFHLIKLGFLLFAGLGTNSFGQNFQWAKQTGAAGWDEGTAIAIDQNNNVYTVGLFVGTVDFDPGIGVFNLTSVGEKDAFIYKLDASGNFVWAKQYGDSAAIDEKSSLAIDPVGNLYTTNSFIGNVDFDPGAGSFYLSSTEWERTVFIQKLDSNGNFIWAKKIGCSLPSLIFPTPVHSNSITVDANGNQYLTGYFDGTIDFDTDTNATFYMTSTYQLSDIFICKLDSSGNFVWAKQFSGQTGGGVGYSIALDENNNVYSTGTIGGTVDFDPGLNTFYLTTSVPFQTEIYISKLDSLGNFVWAKSMGPGEGSAIAVDQNNNIYSSGWTPLGYIPVINKHDSAGNFLWAKQLGGSNGQSIALDNNGNVYTTGLCFGTNDFDPGSDVFNLTGGNSDSFISKLDSLGNFIWAGLLTGTSQVFVNAITTDMNNNIYTTGFFNETADFDPSPSTYNLTGPAIGYDIFILKLNTTIGLGYVENSFKKEIRIYPNPTEGYLIIEFDEEQNDLNFILRNIHGQIVNTKFVSKAKRVEFQINEESGIYLLEISDQNNQKTVLKIIKK